MSNDWIKIDAKDETTLPPLNLPVWIVSDSDPFLGFRAHDDEGWLWAMAEGYPWKENGAWKCDGVYEDLSPTHWMKLPERPE